MASRISVNTGSGNSLSPTRYQATITWISADLLWIQSLERNFSEIWIKIVNCPRKETSAKFEWKYKYFL